MLDRALAVIARRQGAITLAALLFVSAIAWLSLAHLRAMPSDMASMDMGSPAAWTVRDVTLAAIMWAVMMVAMMLPSAAPMMLTFTTINERRRDRGGDHVDTGAFALGYLVVWTGFAVLAAIGQSALAALALLSNRDAIVVGPVASGVILIATGVYELTPLKHACLSRCRSPMAFLVSAWRDGRAGAFVMGLEHGAWCLGCCWLLMLLLFVGGVMHLAWVGVIAAFVLVEKLVPGRVVTWLTGLALVAWGVATLARTL